MTLNNSKKEIESIFEHFRPKLEEKAEDSYALMEKIIQKTKPDLDLTRSICKSICDSENYIERGQELSTVERFIDQVSMNKNTQEPILYPNRIWLITTVIAVFASIFGTISFLNLIKPKPGTLVNYCPDNQKRINDRCVYKTFANVPVPQGKFLYGGSTTFAPLRSKKLKDPSLPDTIKKFHPKFELKYDAPKEKKLGSEDGIQMLLDGELSFSESSRPLKEEENYKLDQKEVAIDGIAIFVHIETPIKSLTISQLNDIFTGDITNWKDINPDPNAHTNQNITCYIRDSKVGGTQEFFRSEILQGREYKCDQTAKNTSDLINKVKNNKGSISFASASEVVDQERIRSLPIAQKNKQPIVSPYRDDDMKKPNIEAFANGKYPIIRKLYIVIKKDGGNDKKAGYAYANLLLSEQGQEIIKKAGFAPIP